MADKREKQREVGSDQPQLHMFLPKRSATGFNLPNTPALWHGDQSVESVLNDISKHIDPGDHALMQPINSVPDIWARPLLFATSLAGGAGFERILSEWRGLLSLIALRPFYRQDLVRFDLLDLTVTDTFDSFRSALLKISPAVERWGGRDYDSTKVLLIRVRDAAKADEWVNVGAFSPKTLAYTGTSYQRSLTAAGKPLAFADAAGNLISPSDPEHPARLEALLHWLRTTKASLSNLADGSEGTVFPLLETWIDDLENLLSKSSGTSDQEKLRAKYEILENTSGEASPELSQFPLYQILTRSVRQIGQVGSAFALQAERPQPFEVIVVHEQLLPKRNLDWGRLEHLKSYAVFNRLR